MNPTYKEYVAAQAIVDTWEEHCEEIAAQRKTPEHLSPRERLWMNREALVGINHEIKYGRPVVAHYLLNIKRRRIKQLLLVIHKRYRHKDGKDWRTDSWCDEPKRTIGNLISRTNNTKDE